MSIQKKVIITGASGFVGTHLIRSLCLHQSSEIHAVIRCLTRPDNMLESQVTSHQMEINDKNRLTRLVSTIRPDQIYHLAGYSDVSKSFTEAEQCWQVNLYGTMSLLDAVVSAGKPWPRIVFAGSGAVYGEPEQDDPIHESTPFRPRNPYASSKAAADLLCFQYFAVYQLPIIRARAFNHIGPGQSTRFSLASFAQQIAEIEKHSTEGVLHVGDLSAERDFCDVEDVVTAYQSLMEKGVPGEAYNIGLGISHPMQHFVDLLLQASYSKITLQKDASRIRPSDTKRLQVNVEKIKTSCGWLPKVDIRTSIRGMLEWFRKEASRINPLP